MTTEGFPLSPQQRRLNSLAATPEAPLGWAVALLALRGPLDRGLARRALAAVVQEHEILRSAFRAGPEGPLQVPLDDPRFAWREADSSGRTEEEARADAALRFEQARGASRELESGAPLEATWITRAEDRADLLIALPAACSDWIGLDNLTAAFARAYAALEAGGAPPQVDPDQPQYADVATWLNELLESEESLPGLRRWRAVDLARAVALRIPFQREAPGAFEPGCVECQLPARLAERVQALAGQLGVDAGALLLAAWCALLARLSGESEVSVGVVADGRRFEELREPLGLLERSLPLVLPAARGRSFAELARAAAAELEEALRWQECWQWPADPPPPGRLPFGFDLRPEPARFRAGSLSLVVSRQSVLADRFDCRLSCQPREEGWTLVWDYDRGAFGAATVERLAGQFRALLEDALARPETEIGRLDVLSAAERQDRLVAFNATERDYPRGVCAHHAFEQHARRQPQAVAVRQGARALTYGELDARANQLAHHLAAGGVGPDTLVALCLERSVEMVVGILGILKAGGAYVPVDPAYPEERIRFLLEDTGAPVLLTQDSLAAGLETGGARVVRIDGERAEIESRPTRPLDSGVQPHNLVYVIYTSGSTGRPKGVVITHEKLVISNSARVECFGHTPETFLLMSSVAFDSSVVGIFWTLCGGGTLLLIPEELEGDLSRIPAVVASEGVTHLLTLPSVYRLILDHAAPHDLAGLHTVIVAGEACPLKMVERHRQLLPGVGLKSEYGATETTVFSSVYDCLQQTLPIAPVGAPIANAQMYVLDEHLAPCPLGVPGEVHFGGTAIALGYWRRPELTAERFVPDPFHGRPGARLYKSGDLARHLENGDVEFLGRIDNQVKIRGFRVELEEIEVGLLKHPALKETAVLAPADENGDRRLVAYAVPEESAPSVAELRAFLAETLPDYMVPGVFVFLDDFPRTPNGKVDRKGLPEPGSERPELAGDYQAPTTESERILAEIWAEVLRVEKVGVRDNFFELGGDSILSIQIVSRAKKAGLVVTPRQLFENQTVAELAAAAKLLDAAAPARAEQGPVSGAVPLTPVQRWFFSRDLTRPDHWSMPLLLDVVRRIERGSLERALAALCDHHDALRLRFERQGTDWKQEIAPPGSAAPVVVVEDLGAIPAAQRADELAQRAAAHHAALDLASGQLVRAVLFEAGPDQPQKLLWIVHHLAVDGVSYRVLLEDLESALDAVEAGREVRLPPRTTSFQRWAELLEQRAARPDAQDELLHWHEVLEAGSGQAWPRDRSDGENRESSARSVTVALDPEETRALLSEVPRAYNTQITDVLLTALVEAYASWSGSSSLFLNLEGHGREEELFGGVDLSRTVGWFTSDYPVCLVGTRPFDPGPALRSIKEQLRRVPSRGFDYGLLRWLSPDGAALAARREPSMAFNYLGQFDQVFREEGRFRWCADPSGPAHHPEGQRVFELEVYGQVSRGRLEMVFEYGRELFQRASIERLASEFTRALRALIEHCTSPEAGGFTASDFADFAWSEADLGEISAAIGLAQQESEPSARPDEPGGEEGA